jgi:glycosyltransferase involved in cell wall biosynthesis
MNQIADISTSAKAAQKLLRYVLITPARNEADYIELTLKAVTSQTIKPLKWVIVSDGSTDGTDELVAKYAATNPWIELLRMPPRQERHFAGKVRAFDAGFAKIKELEFDLVGNLDADISFEEDFFSFLHNKFAENPRLGLAGTAFTEGNQQYDYRFTSIEHVSGQCQIFRRECFEEIGGYVPQKGGGIDVVVVLKARMKGWETRTFQEKTFVHHRQMGTAKYGAIMVKFKDGEKDYMLGTHPLWEIFRWVYQMKNPPYVVGGCALLVGYLGCMLRRRERSVSKEVMDFRRREQMSRLRKFLSKFLPIRTSKIAPEISNAGRAATGSRS